MASRNADNGKFHSVGNPQGPNESKPDVTHLNLGETTKPVAQRFTKKPLSQEQGQARQSPMNDPHNIEHHAG